MKKINNLILLLIIAFLALSGILTYLIFNNYELEKKMLMAETKNAVSDISTTQEIFVLVVCSILLFLFLVGLVIYAIKNLIKEKKIADVKTDFINNITHELKTPLATLSNAAKSLKKEDTQNSVESFDSTLEIIDRQKVRLEKLIDQILTKGLSSEGVIPTKEAMLDTTYFNELIGDFKLSVQDKNVDVHAKMEFREVELHIDKFMFTTALLNILENAVKYGKNPVGIMIRTYLREDQYEITIHDNGIGIHPREQKKVFDKFYRVTSEDVSEVKGLGLGLFYSRQIIKAHNGSISLESKVDKGTTFTIRIPLEE